MGYSQFFNRDLSWVEFNARILHEGCKKSNPLLERLGFLAIVSTNFAEFFQVRVASLKRLAKTTNDAKDISGFTTDEIIKKINERSHEIIKNQYEEFNNQILPELSEHGLVYVKPKDFTDQQKAFSLNFFQNEIFPLLTPLRIEPNNFPHISGKNSNVIFKLKQIPGIHSDFLNSDFQKLSGEKKDVTKNNLFALIQIPQNEDKIIWFPSANSDEDEENEDDFPRRTTAKKYFTTLDDIILTYGTKLFPGFDEEKSMIFSIDRDADSGVDEDSGSHYIEAMEETLAGRDSSFAVRMLCTDGEENEELRELIAKNQELSEDDIYKINGPVHLEDFREISSRADKELFFNPWKNYYPTEINAKDNIFKSLKESDIVLNFPYESFDPVIKFISDAADDPKVLAIKITLYRTGKRSEIIKALMRAAKSGKQVTAFVEIKARFDEQRNIAWVKQLEKSGVIVIYGIVNLKVHSKAALVVRRENDGIKRYVHLSTGNYNADTAKIYSDISLFTSKSEIANDITMFFNLVSGYSILQSMNTIFMAPINLKTRLLKMIEREIENSTPENPGLIVAKMNSLGHEEIIQMLYRASQAGVKVLLNVRGICQLVPGVKGLSENIKVISIVGRYLEHSRIFYFKNSGEEELYLSSADWMPRNLDRRVELMFPITDKQAFKTIKTTLMNFFDDDTNSHELQADGKWVPKENEGGFSAQQNLHDFYKRKDNPSKKDAKQEFEIRRTERKF